MSPKLPGGHGEADLAVRRAQGDSRGEVIDHLRQHAGEVDRVHARQPAPSSRKVKSLNMSFSRACASSKTAGDGERMGVFFSTNGGHLAALPRPTPLPWGVEDEDIHVVEGAEGLHCGGFPCHPRSRRRWSPALARARQGPSGTAGRSAAIAEILGRRAWGRGTAPAGNDLSCNCFKRRAARHGRSPHRRARCNRPEIPHR